MFWVALGRKRCWADRQGSEGEGRVADEGYGDYRKAAE